MFRPRTVARRAAEFTLVSAGPHLERNRKESARRLTLCCSLFSVHLRCVPNDCWP